MRQDRIGGAALPTIAISIVLLVAWEAAGRSNVGFSFLFSRPTQVAEALWKMALGGTLLTDMGVTAVEALVGTAAGTVLGSALGLALWLSKRAARISAPFITVAANFPIFALAPAAIVWLGIGMGMKVFLAAFATFFVSLQLAHRGAETAVRSFGGVFDGFRASRRDTYIKIVVPGALDSVFSSMRVNVGLGILGAFIGEFLASESGLGHTIVRASGLYQIDRVLAASFCIVVMAWLFDLVALGIQSERLAIARLFGVPRVLRERSDEVIDESGDD